MSLKPPRNIEKEHRLEQNTMKKTNKQEDSRENSKHASLRKRQWGSVKRKQISK